MNVAELRAQLQQTDRSLRDQAFNRIARSADQSLLAPLAELAQPTDIRLETLFCQYLQNLPAQVALPHLQRLLDSPHPPTRANAMRALDRLSADDRAAPLVGLLHNQHRDVKLYALRELGTLRRTLALGAIDPIVADEDRALGQAAINALVQIDAPRSLRTLTSHLGSPESWRRIAVADGLGRMASFRRWRRLVPLLDDPDPKVRQTVAISISRKAGERATQHLVARLREEQEDDVARVIANRLAVTPNLTMAKALVETASAHANLQVRRSAGWVVEELDQELLLAAMRELLPKVGESTQAYILTRMGVRQLAGCGPTLTSYVAPTHSQRVRYAAVEALGFLRQSQHLPAVQGLLFDADPILAYVAALACVQLIQHLSDCPPLTALLRSPDGEHVALKQVVLQYLTDSAAWHPDDVELEQVLLTNLDSRNENISYLSAIALGKGRGQRQLLQPLMNMAMNGRNLDLRQVATTSLDQVLDGDLAPLLDVMGSSLLTGRTFSTCIEVLGRLHCSEASAAQTLELMLAIDDELIEGGDAGLLRGFARGLVRANLPATRQFVAGAKGWRPWHRVIAIAWLDSLVRMRRATDRDDWQAIFSLNDPVVVEAAAQAAGRNQRPWALDPLLAAAHMTADPQLQATMRSSAKAVLGL